METVTSSLPWSQILLRLVKPSMVLLQQVTCNIALLTQYLHPSQVRVLSKEIHRQLLIAVLRRLVITSRGGIWIQTITHTRRIRAWARLWQLNRTQAAMLRLFWLSTWYRIALLERQVPTQLLIIALQLTLKVKTVSSSKLQVMQAHISDRAQQRPKEMLRLCSSSKVIAARTVAILPLHGRLPKDIVTLSYTAVPIVIRQKVLEGYRRIKVLLPMPRKPIVVVIKLNRSIWTQMFWQKRQVSPLCKRWIRSKISCEPLRKAQTSLARFRPTHLR